MEARFWRKTRRWDNIKGLLFWVLEAPYVGCSPQAAGVSGGKQTHSNEACGFGSARAGQLMMWTAGCLRSRQADALQMLI